MDISGVPNAQMSYKEDRYARLVMLRYAAKLMGWPEGIPFVNLSSGLLGGIAALRILRQAWDKGELRFERATPEDLARAAEDPLSVLPDGGRCLKVLAQAKSHSESTPPPPDVQPVVLVMHPIDLSDVGTHDPEADVDPDSGKHQREQRSDVKKARRRPVKNPTNRPLRRPKLGVKSSRGVLELDDVQGAKRGRKRARYSLVDDPVRQFVNLKAGGVAGTACIRRSGRA